MNVPGIIAQQLIFILRKRMGGPIFTLFVVVFDFYLFQRGGCVLFDFICFGYFYLFIPHLLGI